MKQLNPIENRMKKKFINWLMILMLPGLGEKQDTLPAPEKDAQYYVSDLGINVFSPDGKTHIREDNGQPFDWNQYKLRS